MIGVMFLGDFLLGPGLYAVRFYLPLEQESGSTRQFVVQAGTFYQSMADDAEVNLESVYDYLADDVVGGFAESGFDANPYREVIRQAVAQVDPTPD